MKWFGQGWGAPVCEPKEHVATPVGVACMRCERPISEGDQGVSMPHVTADWHAELMPQHLDCFLEGLAPCKGCEHCKGEPQA